MTPAAALDRFGMSLLVMTVVGAMTACTTTEMVGDKGVSRRMPTLIVAKTENGAKLQWNSKIGDVYTILYSESTGPTAKWQSLPNYATLQGTGGTMLATDDTPDAQHRDYRLYVIPAARAN